MTPIPQTYQCPWIKGNDPEEPGRYWVVLTLQPHEKHLMTYTETGWEEECAKTIARGHGVVRYTPADPS